MVCIAMQDVCQQARANQWFGGQWVGRAMVVRPLVRAGLQTLARGGLSWVTSLPSAGRQQRGMRSSSGRAGAVLSASTSRIESRDTMDKTGGNNTAPGGVGTVFGSRAFNGAALHEKTGDSRVANGHSSGHGQAANGTDGMSKRAGSSKSAFAAGAVAQNQQIGDPRQHARDVILGGAAALERLAAMVDESFDRAVDMIEGRSPGSRVLVVGIGKSGHLARKMAATLSSTGTASFFMHGTEALHGDLGGAQVLTCACI